MSKQTIDFVSLMKPNHVYNVSINEKGEPTLFTVVGLHESSEPIKLAANKSEDIEQVINDCLASVKSGSMVLAITNEPKPNIKVTSQLGVGYIIYSKVSLKVTESLESALEFLKEKAEDKDFAYALRFKRRQNKWFVHAGVYSAELPKTYKPSAENKFRLYDLNTRSHVMGEE